MHRAVPALLAAAAVTLIGCGQFRIFPRQMVYESHPSHANHGVVMDYSVYTPPGWEPGERLPLVMFLHGGGDSHDSFDRHGITNRLNEAVEAGRVPRAIIVLPNGHLGFWANWWSGNRRYEDWAVEEVIPRIRASYDTLACPEHCHVMGVSMGGSGALRFAHHRPDVFSSVASLSGPMFNTDAMMDFVSNRLLAIVIPTYHVFGPPVRERVERDDLFLQWTSVEATRLEEIFIAWGDHDRGQIIQGARAFHTHLEEHEIPHVAIEYEGNHSWVSWGPIIEQALAEQVN